MVCRRPGLLVENSSITPDTARRLGTLTESQISDVLMFFREQRKDMADVQTEWSSSPAAQRLHVAAPICWAVFYELPFVHHVISMLVCMGFEEKLRAVAASPDPQAAMIDFGKSAFDPSTFDHLDELTDQEQAALFCLCIGAGYSMRSFATYSLPLHRLVALAGTGDKEAFRRAVSIDPTSVAAPSMLKCLSKAVMENDQKFMREYRAALKGPHKTLQPYEELRVAHLILEDAKAFSEPRERIFDLIVNKLKLYDHNKGDAMKGLFSRFGAWRQESTK